MTDGEALAVERAERNRVEGECRGGHESVQCGRHPDDRAHDRRRLRLAIDGVESREDEDRE